MSSIAVLQQLNVLRPAGLSAAGAQTVSGSGFTDVPGASGWDPAKVGGAMSLSNNNKTVSSSAGWGTTPNSTFGTGIKVTTGKFYFELTIGSYDSTTEFCFGLANGNAVTGDTLGVDAGGYAAYVAGGSNKWTAMNNNSPTGGASLSNAALSAGAVLQFAVDSTGVGMWWGVNNTWLAGSPSAGTGASFASFALTGGIKPAIGVIGNTSATSATLNTGGPFTYTPPTGFVAWG